MRRLFLSAAAACALTLPVLAQNPPAGQSPQTPQATGPATQSQRPAQAPLGPNQWAIDGSHSAAGFSVKHNVVSTVRGQLGAITGKIDTTARTSNR